MLGMRMGENGAKTPVATGQPCDVWRCLIPWVARGETDLVSPCQLVRACASP